MTFTVHMSPAKFRAGKLDELAAQLAAGSCDECPGKWRVLHTTDVERIGMLRVFRFELEPLDAKARATSENQLL